MNTVPYVPWDDPPEPKKPKAPARKRRINYEAKLSANEEATMRWTSELKLAATKLTKLSSKRRRLLAAQAEQNNKPRVGSSPFSRKFV